VAPRRPRATDDRPRRHRVTAHSACARQPLVLD
jgi:hypothetical protein